MASPDMYNIPPNANNPNMVSSDACYPPSAPPPTYPIPAPPPYAIPSVTQVPMYSQGPLFITPMQMPYHGVIMATNMIPSQTMLIKDYMVWSIINIFLGGFILGIIAVLLSSQTRKRKLEGDIQGARTMSHITLTCNILITLVFFAITTFLIIYFVAIFSTIDQLYR